MIAWFSLFIHTRHHSIFLHPWGIVYSYEDEIIININGEEMFAKENRFLRHLKAQFHRSKDLFILEKLAYFSLTGCIISFLKYLHHTTICFYLFIRKLLRQMCIITRSKTVSILTATLYDISILVYYHSIHSVGKSLNWKVLRISTRQRLNYTHYSFPNSRSHSPCRCTQIYL